MRAPFRRIHPLVRAPLKELVIVPIIARTNRVAWLNFGLAVYLLHFGPTSLVVLPRTWVVKTTTDNSLCQARQRFRGS